MNIVVIGGVAAGTKTAAKLMRQDRSAKVTVYTKGKDISYAGCGLPYYVGGSIETREELIVNTPEKYTALTGVAVRTEMEAVSVDAAAKTVSFANGEVVSYDKLVIATGAVPFVPNVAGTNLPGVFAAGDCTGGPLQVSKAVGEGLIAGQSAAAFAAELARKTT